MRPVLLLVSTMTLVVLLAGGVALAEIRVGTDNSETLLGTNSADHITGKGGNDTLVGRAANDTYHFADGFGHDTLTETKVVKVGKKKLPGGSDTLSFAGMSSGGSGVRVELIPQWVSFDPSHNQAYQPGTTNIVELGTSPVENVVGSPTGDQILGGSASNTLHRGAGGNDTIIDFGGCFPTENSSCESTLPASNDTYLGFSDGGGGGLLWDYGGTADRLDLRPLRSSEVHFDALNWDGIGGDDSLMIVIDSDDSLLVIGHFAPVPGDVDDGRIEQIIFSDEVVTSGAELNSLMQ